MTENRFSTAGDDTPDSPFLRAYAEASRPEEPAPEISSDRLADRLVARINGDRDGPTRPSPTAPDEGAEFRAWRLCRALVRRVGDLRMTTRFTRRG